MSVYSIDWKVYQAANYMHTNSFCRPLTIGPITLGSKLPARVLVQADTPIPPIHAIWCLFNINTAPFRAPSLLVPAGRVPRRAQHRPPQRRAAAWGECAPAAVCPPPHNARRGGMYGGAQRDPRAAPRRREREAR